MTKRRPAQVCSETGVTLSRFMIETALANPELSELESIFSSIETASKTISNLVRRSGSARRVAFKMRVLSRTSRGATAGAS